MQSNTGGGSSGEPAAIAVTRRRWIGIRSTHEPRPERQEPHPGLATPGPARSRRGRRSHASQRNHPPRRCAVGVRSSFKERLGEHFRAKIQEGLLTTVRRTGRREALLFVIEEESNYTSRYSSDRLDVTARTSGELLEIDRVITVVIQCLRRRGLGAGASPRADPRCLRAKRHTYGHSLARRVRWPASWPPSPTRANVTLLDIIVSRLNLTRIYCASAPAPG